MALSQQNNEEQRKGCSAGTLAQSTLMCFAASATLALWPRGSCAARSPPLQFGALSGSCAHRAKAADVPPESTFHELASDWLESRRHEFAAGTVDDYTLALDHHLLLFFKATTRCAEPSPRSAPSWASSPAVTAAQWAIAIRA